MNSTDNSTLSTPSFERLLSNEALESLRTGGDQGLVTSYHVIRHFITPAICLFSMGALIFTLIFLNRRKLVRVTALIYLKFMGFVDLMSLVVLFISSLDYFMISSHVHEYYTSMFVRCLYGCLLGLLLASNWLMTAQAIERTIAISRPFKAKQIREKHRRIVVSVICVLSILLTIPTIALDILELKRYRRCWRTQDGNQPCIDVELETSRQQNVYKNGSALSIANSSLYFQSLNHSHSLKRSAATGSGKAAWSPQFTTYVEDLWPESLKTFQTVQAWVVHFLIFFVLPFVFLCLASFCLLSAVRMSGRFVRQHCIRGGAEFRNTLREEARMTVLILCLIGAFFICQSPFVAYSACHKVGILSKPSPGHSLLRAFITLALALKSDCTFVFHCWLNQRFALALRRMLCSFSASTVSGRANASKSHSGDEMNVSSPNHCFRQTRSLVKQHTVKQQSEDCEKEMKILLREIDHQRKNACYVSQNCQTNYDKSRKDHKLNITRPGDFMQFNLKRVEKKRSPLPCEEIKVAYDPLDQNQTVSDTQQKKKLESHQTETTEAHSKDKQASFDQRKQFRLRPYNFCSENDLCTSCTSKCCYYDLSCPVGSSCSSLECTGDLHAHCGCSLHKSQCLL